MQKTRNTIQYNAAQLAAINSELKEIFVSASAGSGKTTIMIERVLRLLLGGAALSSMIICTFTKASASDMRAKLLARLLEHDDEAWAQNALQQLPLAQIGTIDSFCARLCRDYFFNIELDPYFELIDEVEADTLLSTAIDEVLDENLVRTDEGAADFLELFEMLSPNRRDGKLVGILKDLVRRVSVVTDRERWLSSAQCTTYTATLTQLLSEVLARYALKKQARAKLDYSDVEHFAYTILQVDSAHGAINDKYQYLFVDEYQDINPLQDAIFGRFVGNKFFVGDVKQSIYQFRQSDPSIFLSHLDRAKGRIYLNENYRSDSAILSFCDGVFGRVMSSDLGGVDYAVEGAFGAGGRGKRIEDNIICNIIETGEVDTVANEAHLKKGVIYSVRHHINAPQRALKHRAEVNCIVEHVKNLLTQSVPFDGSKGELRAAGYEDIAILLRTRGDFMHAVKNALTGAGVPSVCIGDSEDSNSLIAHDLINYLRLIDNFNDDIVLASVLKSPIFGRFNDEELLSIRQSVSGKRFFYEAVEECIASNTHNKLFVLKQNVLRYTQLSKIITISQLAGRIVAEHDCFNKLTLEHEINSLAQFLDSLDAIDKALPFNASLKRAELIAKRGSIVAQSTAGAVKIMTIHSSKGLEFPFVIVGNLGKRFNKSDTFGDVLSSGGEGFCMLHYNKAAGLKEKSDAYLQRARIIEHNLLEEEMRLLYVALTRGIYQVALFATTPKNNYEPRAPHEAACCLDWLYASMRQRAVFHCRSNSYSGNTSGNVGAVRSVVHTRLTDTPVAADVASRAQKVIYTHQLIPLKRTATDIAADALGGAKKQTNTLIVNSQSSLQIGNAYHKFFELADFSASLQHNIAAFTKQCPTMAALLQKARLEKNFNELKNLIANRKFYRELPFIYKDDNGQLVQGVIDLLIEGSRGVEIIDYKTGQESAQNKAVYEAQLTVYKKAAEIILKRPVVKVEVVYL